MIRLVAAARTTVIVVTWLAGVPLLLACAGPRVPALPPSAAQLSVWLGDPLQVTYLDETAAVMAWLVWAVVATATGRMLLRRHPLRWAMLAQHLPPPARSLMAAMLGGVAVTTGSSPAVTAAVTSTAPVAADHLLQDASPVSMHHDANPRHDANRYDAAGPTVLVQHVTTGRGTAATADVRDTCRVERGDTLWELADTHLGDPHRWPEIYRLNKGDMQADGSALTNPDEITIGWVLALPDTGQDGQPPAPLPQPDTDQPAPPPPAAEAPPSPHDTTAPPTRGPSPAAPADRGTPPAGQPGSAASSASATGETGNSPAPSPEYTGREETGQEDRALPPTDPAGVEVPGGWLTVALSGGLLAAATLAWRHRRHRYRPTPITSPDLDDADLVPPLAAMTRIRAGLRRATGPDDTLPPHVQTAPAEPPPEQLTGGNPSTTAAPAQPVELALTGDGAHAAARGLLIGALTAGNGTDPDSTGRVIIPAATMSTLLGGSDIGHLDQLIVATSMADAITRLEEEIIRRSRQIADAHTPGVSAAGEPAPLLFIADADPAFTSRLGTAARLGRSLGIGTALIGTWPDGTAVTVAADGTIDHHSSDHHSSDHHSSDHDSTVRLAVLDITATIDMLNLLREAHGDSDGPTAQAQPAIPGRPDEDTARPTGKTPAPATTAGAAPVAIRVLGRPAVLNHDGKPSAGIRSKAIELLVYLAVNRHGADLSDIMEALFPDANLRRAGERLSTVVANLRKHIREAAGTPPDPARRLEPIPNTGSRYHLDPAIVRVDWWTVLDEYEATAAAGTDEQRLTHLTTAIDAAGGALADGVDYDWIDTDREVVRRHRIKLHAHAAALLADTDPHRSWLLLEHACGIDPLSDDLTRAAIRAAAALGDADAVRHRLTTLHAALDTHGLEPSDETDTLAHRLLQQLRPSPPG